MAYHKKTTRRKRRVGKVTHHRKRHRHMGAVSKHIIDGMQLFFGATIGVIVGELINDVQTIVPDNVIGWIYILLGGGVAILVDQPFVQGIGAGIAGNGALTEAQSLGFLKGIGRAPRMRKVAGYSNVAKIGNDPTSFPKPSAVGWSAKLTPLHTRGVYGQVV